MTNFEKYKDDLMKIEESFAFDKNTKKITECNASINCENCLFDTKHPCEMGKIKWLYEEYKEPFLSDDELELIKSINKYKKRKYRFIARLGVYKVGLFVDKPNYYSGRYTSPKDYIIIQEVDENIFSNITFDDGIYDIENKTFIK